MQKGISIILPTLNRADYLASTVDCLIEQDFGEPYEIIIVDQSAAIDSTMYSRAKDSDTLIKYYHVTEFRGLPEARNFGVQHTQYAYILFLDEDMRAKRQCQTHSHRTGCSSEWFFDMGKMQISLFKAIDRLCIVFRSLTL